MTDVNDVLVHFGVRGMKWGVRRAAKKAGVASVPTPRSKRQEARLTRKIKATTAAISAGKKRIKLHEAEMEDLHKNGIHAKSMQRKFGRDVDTNGFVFASAFGMSKSTAVQQAQIESFHAFKAETAHVRRSEKRLAKLESRKSKLTHDDTSEELGDFLEHFGVRGMKWGTRRAGKVDTSSADAQVAVAASLKAKKSGVKSLSNKELQDLVTRMNLEQQLSKLKESQPTKFQRGKKVVSELLSAGRMVNDAISLAKSPAVHIVKSKLGK